MNRCSSSPTTNPLALAISQARMAAAAVLLQDRLAYTRTTDDEAGLCRHCGEDVTRVPGGQGPTWVHEATGMVAARGQGADDHDLGNLYLVDPT